MSTTPSRRAKREKATPPPAAAARQSALPSRVVPGESNGGRVSARSDTAAAAAPALVLLEKNLALVTGSTPLSVEQRVASANMARNARIREIREQLSSLEGQLESLESERDDACRLTLVTEGGHHHWSALPKARKWDKQVVLSLLQSCGGDHHHDDDCDADLPTLPAELRESAWIDPKSKIPAALRSDRDVFLARLRRPGFAGFHRRNDAAASPPARPGKGSGKRSGESGPPASSSSSSKGAKASSKSRGDGGGGGGAGPVFPGHLLADQDVLVELVAVYPDALRQLRPKNNPRHRAVLDSEAVFRALLDRHAAPVAGTAPANANAADADPDAGPRSSGGPNGGRHLHHAHNDDEDWDLCRLLGLFSMRLRSDPDLVADALVRLAARHRSCTADVVDRADRFVAKSLQSSPGFCARVANAVFEASLAFPAEEAGAGTDAPKGGGEGDDEEEEPPASHSWRCRRVTTRSEVRRRLALWLSDLPPAVRSDARVALAFCRLKGRDLVHCARLLDGGDSEAEEAVFRAAVGEDPYALVHVPARSATRASLLSSKGFLLESFKAMDDERCDPEEVLKFFKIIGRALKNDRDVAVAASCASEAVLSHVRAKWEADREFWTRVVEDGSGCWCCIPPRWRADRDFARLVALHSVKSFPGVVFQYPHLLEDRAVLLRMVKVLTPPAWSDLLGMLTPDLDRVVADKDYCLELVRADGRFYEYVPEPFQMDRDVVREALSVSPWYPPSRIVFVMQHDARVAHVDLIADAIRNEPGFDEDDGRDTDFADSLCEHMWSHKPLALAWISRGGWWVEGFPEEYSSDKDILLALAEHSSDPCETFEQVCSPELLRDKEFMVQVVKKRPSLYWMVPSELDGDFDIMLAAHSGDKDLLRVMELDEPEELEQVLTFARRVRKRIEARESFTTFLAGMSKSAPSPSCCLPVLNQGSETSLAYKKLIADFVGLPCGEELRDLRAVSVHLTRWGY